MEDPQPYKNPSKFVSTKKDSKNSEKNPFPNFQFNSGNHKFADEIKKAKNSKVLDQKYSSVEVKSTQSSQQRNKTHKHEHTLEAKIQQEIVLQEAAKQQATQRQLQQKKQTFNSALNNVQVAEKIYTNQPANSQIVNMSSAQAVPPISLIAAQAQEINMMRALALTSTTAKRNYGMMLPSAYINNSGFFQSMPVQFIPGLGHNVPVISAVQPNVQLQMLQAAANIAELQRLLFLQTIQSNSKIAFPQPMILRQQPKQQLQVQKQQTPSSQITQKSQDNSNAASSKRAKAALEWYERKAACNCPNCINSDRNRKLTCNRQHVCNISGCNRIFHEVWHLRSHYLKCHSGERPFVCNWKFCNKKFKYVYTLQQHVLTHNEKMKFQCSYCKIEFQRLNQLAKHVVIHTKTKSKLIKSNATPTIATPKQTQPHDQVQVQTRVEVDQAPPTAQQTQHNVSTISNENTKETTKESYSDKKISKSKCKDACTCPKCPENQRNRDVTDGRKYVCHVSDCKKQYSREWHLRMHMRSHTGERPHVCTWESCDKKFSRMDGLQRHMRTHTGERKFQCPLCASKFQRPDHLAKHVNIHTISGSTTESSAEESS